MHRIDERTTPAGASYRHAGSILGLLFLCTVAAFWTSYLSRLDDPPATFDWTLHVHAALMGGWIALLCLQAWLVRRGHRRLHRLIGWSSFAYVPLTIVSGVVTMRGQMLREGVTSGVARDAAFQHVMLAAFAITWALAIAHRRRPAIHVRYMISTVFAIGSAIFFRIFFFLVPDFADYDRAAHANFAVMGLMLAALIWNDRRLGLKRSPYWVITGLLAVEFVFYRVVAPTDGWAEYLDRLAAALG